MSAVIGGHTKSWEQLHIKIVVKNTQFVHTLMLSK